MIGVRHSRRAGLVGPPRNRRFFITPIASFLASDLGLGEIAATVGATALEGGAVGAGVSALTGGKPLTGALTGAITGGALGGLTGPVADTLGIGTGAAGALVGGVANAGGAALTGGSPLTGALTGALAGYGYGSGPGAASSNSGAAAASLLDSNGNAIVPPIPPQLDASGNPVPGLSVDPSTGQLVSGASTGGTYDTGGNPVSQQAAATAGAGGGLFGGKSGGISNTSLALGALAALGSAVSKPAIGTWATPGPSSVAASPTFNAPLNTSFPGRTALSPPGLQTGSAPNYWSYGGPEQTYFGNNSLQSYGFAHGGALNEFSAAKDGRHVHGPGTGTSDSVPAMLSKGEYILTADDLARIGNGDNARGAAMLDRDRKALAKKVGEPQFAPKGLGHALYESRRGAA